MAGSLNKVQIIGNLGADPEIRYTNDNRAIASLNVATSENWKDKDGNRQEKTEWHRVVLFGPVAEVAEKYLHKGDTAYFEGKMQTRKWQDKDGNDRYTTEVVVDRGGTMTMLTTRKSGGSDYDAGDSYGSNSGSDYSAPAASSAKASKPAKVTEEPAFDDEIPF